MQERRGILQFCPQRSIPERIRRQLRQEVNFGCAICGNPLIQIHHIIPWSQTHNHVPSEMIALCPNHHEHADAHEYSTAYLHKLKESPHNINVIGDVFSIQTQDLDVSIGSNHFINASRIISVDNFDIVSITRSGQYPAFNVNLFDRFDNWIAVIDQNEWYVDKRFFWDIEYRPKHLILRNAPRNIALDVKIEDDVIYLKGNLFFNGYSIEATENDLFLGGKSQIRMRESTVKFSPQSINALAFELGTGNLPFSRFPHRYKPLNT